MSSFPFSVIYERGNRRAAALLENRGPAPVTCRVGFRFPRRFTLGRVSRDGAELARPAELASSSADFWRSEVVVELAGGAATEIAVECTERQ
jgi:hypothetical protein